MVARIGCVLLMAWALDAQTGSGGNGWSQQGSLEQADAIVIGEITGGEGVDRFSSVQAQATLHVRRVIKGAPAPETDLKLAWQYRPSPMEGPDVTTRVKPVYGLWLLRAATDGTWRPLPVATGPMDMGGVYLALPRVELTGDFFYPGDAPAGVRLACELGAALEAIGNEQGDRLNQPRTALAGGGWSGRLTPAQAQFQQLNSMLAAADRAASLPVYRRFAASPQANLRAVGIAGLARAGDEGAVIALASDAAALAPTLQAMDIPNNLDGKAFQNNPQLLFELARAALSETEFPNLEGRVAFLLGWSRQMEAFPYLAAMLGSPDAFTRGAAIQSFCTAVRQTGELWRQEMGRYCPSGSPVSDPALERACIGFWSAWWQGERKRLENPPPGVPRPARYHNAPVSAGAEPVEVPIEQRFGSLISMTMSFLQSRPNERRSPLAMQIGPGEDEKLLAVAQDVSAKLEAQNRAAMDVINDARVHGRQPDLNEMRQANEQHTAILREGLAELRQRLSPGAWDAVERFLMEMNIHGQRLVAAPARSPR